MAYGRQMTPDWTTEAEAFIRDRLSQGDDSIAKNDLVGLVDDWDATVAQVAAEMSAFWDSDRDGEDDLDYQLGYRGPAADMALNTHRLQ